MDSKFFSDINNGIIFFLCDIVNKFNIYFITMLDDIYELAQVPSMNCHVNKIWKTTQN